MNVKRGASTLVLILIAAISARGQGRTTVPGYVQCNTTGGDTIYFSALFEVDPPPGGDTGGYTTAFADYLKSKYNVTDRVGCGYAIKSTADVQHLSDGQSAEEAQWRINGKKVVETNWTWNGAPVLNRPPVAAPPPSATPAPPSAAQQAYEKALEAGRPRSATGSPTDAAGNPLPPRSTTTPPSAATPPTTNAPSGATASDKDYAYCFANSLISAPRPNYYVSTTFSLPTTAHPEGAFQKFLQAQYPKEQFGSTECRRGSSSDAVLKGRAAFVAANSDHYRMVTVNWYLQ